MIKNKDKRIYYLDYLKIILAILVIIAHVCIAYSPRVWWFYKKPYPNIVYLRIYQLISAIVMNSFFFLFGYFIYNDYIQKGIKYFVKKRTKKYLVPIVISLPLVILPLSYLYHLMNRNMGFNKFKEYFIYVFMGFHKDINKFYDPYGAVFPELKFSYLWFLEHCYIYTLICAFIFFVIKKIKIQNTKFIIILVFVGICLTYIIRCKYDFDYWEGFLGFIQVEYCNIIKYIFSIILGIIISQTELLEKIPRKLGIILFLSSIIFISIFIILSEKIPFVFAAGEAGWNTALWTVSDWLLCYSFLFGIIVVLREYLSNKFSFLLSLSSLTMGVYLIHVPLMVIIQYMMDKMKIEISYRIILQSVLGTVISFVLVYIYKTKICKSVFGNNL